MDFVEPLPIQGNSVNIDIEPCLKLFTKRSIDWGESGTIRWLVRIPVAAQSLRVRWASLCLRSKSSHFRLSSSERRMPVVSANWVNLLWLGFLDCPKAVSKLFCCECVIKGDRASLAPRTFNPLAGLDLIWQPSSSLSQSKSTRRILSSLITVLGLTLINRSSRQSAKCLMESSLSRIPPIQLLANTFNGYCSLPPLRWSCSGPWI